MPVSTGIDNGDFQVIGRYWWKIFHLLAVGSCEPLNIECLSDAVPEVDVRGRLICKGDQGQVPAPSHEHDLFERGFNRQVVAQVAPERKCSDGFQPVVCHGASEDADV